MRAVRMAFRKLVARAASYAVLTVVVLLFIVVCFFRRLGW